MTWEKVNLMQISTYKGSFKERKVINGKENRSTTNQGIQKPTKVIYYFRKKAQWILGINGRCNLNKIRKLDFLKVNPKCIFDL